MNRTRLIKFYGLGYNALKQIDSYYKLSSLKEWKNLIPIEKIQVACNFDDYYLSITSTTQDRVNSIFEIIADIESGYINKRKYVDEVVLEYESISKFEIIDYLSQSLTKNDKIKYLEKYRNDYLKLQLENKFGSPLSENVTLLEFIDQQIEFVNKLSDYNINYITRNSSEESPFNYSFKSEMNKKQIQKLFTFLVGNNFISSDTKFNDFLNIFSHVDIEQINPIKWILKCSKRPGIINKNTLIDLFVILFENKLILTPNINKSEKGILLKKITLCFVDDLGNTLILKHSNNSNPSAFYIDLEKAVKSLLI